MSEQKHTPGPWVISHRKRHDGRYRTQVYPECDQCNTIATVDWHTVVTENGIATDRGANARLIAAAPELLDALKLASAYFDGHVGKIVDAAIAKAENRHD